MIHSHKWNKWFLGMAEYVSTASKDPSTKVGAVIVDTDRTVVSMGYNGFPRGVEDSPERLNDRETKNLHVVHAERNALLFAHRPLKGCVLYTTPFMPCAACAGMVIQAGITEVVSYYVDNTRWKEQFITSSQMFKEAGVKIVLYETKDSNFYYTGYIKQ